MARKLSALFLSTDEQPGCPGPVTAGDSLLAALFGSSTVGVAICDQQLRFRAINDALASMNGVPAEAHLGKTIHAVLGSAAAKIQPAFEHVFATGEPLANFEVTAELPTRGTIGHWSESYFPIKGRAGEVRQVGVVVLELTQPKAIAASLGHLTDNLVRVGTALRAKRKPHHPERRRAEPSEPPVELLENCFSAARTISRLLHSAPSPLAARRLGPPKLVRVKPLDSDEAMDFACSYPIDDEPNEILSSREREVAVLLATGNTNKEIAEILNISTRTVETHRARIMLKLDLHSVTDLVRYAVRSHLIQL